MCVCVCKYWNSREINKEMKTQRKSERKHQTTVKQQQQQPCSHERNSWGYGLFLSPISIFIPIYRCGCVYNHTGTDRQTDKGLPYILFSTFTQSIQSYIHTRKDRKILLLLLLLYNLQTHPHIHTHTHTHIFIFPFTSSWSVSPKEWQCPPRIARWNHGPVYVCMYVCVIYSY